MEKRFSWGSPSSRMVLTAALDVLAEQGYVGVTVDEIRSRAGVAGLLIERSELDDIVVTALQEVRLFAPPPPTGSLRGDLHDLLRPWLGERSQDEVVLAAVMSAAEHSPRLKEAVREVFDRPLARAVSTVLSRAVERGEVAADRGQTLNWILRGLALHRLRTDTARCLIDLDELIDHLLAGLRPAASDRR